MLRLQVTRRHVVVRLDRFCGILLALLEIVLINDLKRERIEDDLFEFFIDAVRMIDGNEAHLQREWKIEIDDTSLRAIARPVIDITIRANIAPGMCTIQLLKFLIHNERYENGNFREVGPNYFLVGWAFLLQTLR